MTPKLAELVERARHHVMTPEEKFEQRVSFVYAQQDHSSGHVMPKDEIRQMLIDAYGMPAQMEQGG